MDIYVHLNQIAQERDIHVEELIHELEEALAASYKRHVGAREGSVSVNLDQKTGWKCLIQKEVVGEVLDMHLQMSLIEARRRKPEAEIGDFMDVEVDPNSFGRIAAQTAKQVLHQKLREAEQRKVHETFSNKLNDIVSGTVLRREESAVLIQVNKIEAELPKWEQVPTEPYRPNDRMRVYVLRVEDGRRGLKVIVSRTHPNLLRKLFELEVPEIQDGIVVLKSVAREAGQRSKISVISTDERVDAVGACVGPRGSRVQSIVDELYDEKIDIVPFSEDPETYITNALSPAKVNKITINMEEQSALVVVPDTQLSLAIGKGGQNVRLAARLTDWKIDIRSEAQMTAEAASASKPSTGGEE
jgi:N utilization substance protein A